MEAILEEAAPSLNERPRPVRRVVGVSIGSSKRDHSVEIDVLGERFRVERIGTDGDIAKAVALIKELDGKVEAFGMGGIDLYIWAGPRRYMLKDARQLALAPKVTPIVDGSGLKNTLERRVVRYLVNEAGLELRGKRVLMVCAVDRFGMAEALVEAGCDMVYGDLIFTLHVPKPLKTLRSLHRLARVIAPVVCRLPFSMLYPTGSSQETTVPKYGRFYEQADIIAGDWLFIKKHMPSRLAGKIILTNTITLADVDDLKSRGVAKLITTTPELEGRSFGTNVMEALLVAVACKKPDEMAPADYETLLDRLGFMPRIVDFGKQR